MIQLLLWISMEENPQRVCYETMDALLEDTIASHIRLQLIKITHIFSKFQLSQIYKYDKQRKRDR